MALRLIGKEEKMIGTTELILIAGVALLLFGGKKLPELMRGMGQGIKSFKEGLNSPVEKEEGEEEDPEPSESIEQDEIVMVNTGAVFFSPFFLFLRGGVILLWLVLFSKD